MAPTSTKPFVGRIVLVTVDPRQNNGSDVAPAVITRVWAGDDLINAKVLLDGDANLWMTNIPLFKERPEPDDERVQNYYFDTGKMRVAFWPPRS